MDENRYTALADFHLLFCSIKESCTQSWRILAFCVAQQEVTLVLCDGAICRFVGEREGEDRSIFFMLGRQSPQIFGNYKIPSRAAVSFLPSLAQLWQFCAISSSFVSSVSRRRRPKLSFHEPLPRHYLPSVRRAR